MTKQYKSRFSNNLTLGHYAAQTEEDANDLSWGDCDSSNLCEVPSWMNEALSCMGAKSHTEYFLDESGSYKLLHDIPIVALTVSFGVRPCMCPVVCLAYKDEDFD